MLNPRKSKGEAGPFSLFFFFLSYGVAAILAVTYGGELLYLRIRRDLRALSYLRGFTVQQLLCTHDLVPNGKDNSRFFWQALLPKNLEVQWLCSICDPNMAAAIDSSLWISMVKSHCYIISEYSMRFHQDPDTQHLVFFKLLCVVI